MKPICLTNSSTPVFVISLNNIQYINGTWLTRFLPNSGNQFSPITRPKMSALVQQHFPRSATHRVHTEWLSGVHSIMKENQLGDGGGGGGGWCTPIPFHYIYQGVGRMERKTGLKTDNFWEMYDWIQIKETAMGLTRELCRSFFVWLWSCRLFVFIEY